MINMKNILQAAGDLDKVRAEFDSTLNQVDKIIADMPEKERKLLASMMNRARNAKGPGDISAILSQLKQVAKHGDTGNGS